MLTPVEEIKNRLDVVEIIQGYLKLQKAGANWKGLCPFHSEKTPSFMVTPSRQIWHCFGCGEGGDVFSFVQKIEGLEFGDVLRMLAEKAGIKLKKQDPQVQSQRKSVYEICELSARFFERQMVSRQGQTAENYLKERGVSKESMESFRIGWAPDRWQSLGDFLRGEGYNNKEIESAGLIVKTERGLTPTDNARINEDNISVGPGSNQCQSASNPYESALSYHDRFRHRIMFPINDGQGQVIGFSGRIFDKIKGKTVHQDAGKYINTPNTLIYNKSLVLYALDKAKSYIRDLGSCVLVEGNLDVIMSHQAGVKNSVATCGTAFCQEHSKIIKRYSDKISFAFDADAAGDNALKKSIGIAMANGLSVSVVSIPLGKDTADVVKTDPALWRESADRPVSFVGYLIKRSIENFSGTLESKKTVLANVLPFIKILPSPLDKDFWLEDLSSKIGVSKDILSAELKKTAPIDFPQQTPQSAFLAIKQHDSSEFPSLRQEEYLLSLLVRYPDLKKRVGEDELELFSRSRFASAAKAILTGEENTASFADSSIMLLSDTLGDFEIDADTEFNKVIFSLKKQYLHSKMKMIQEDIKKAETEKDGVSLELLLKEFNELSKKISSI